MLASAVSASFQHSAPAILKVLVGAQVCRRDKPALESNETPLIVQIEMVGIQTADTAVDRMFTHMSAFVRWVCKICSKCS